MSTPVASLYRMPSLFISHGTPMLALAEDSYTEALRQYAARLPRPRAIVIASAHGLSPEGSVEVSGGSRPALSYDFSGFPSELYQLEYPCPGSPDVAVEVAALLAEAGFEVSVSQETRLDHGVWIPLKCAFPEADIPVVQITLPYPTRPEFILKMGRALSHLREQGILLIGSGGVVHNLRKLKWSGKEGPAEPWAVEFESWVMDQLQRKDVESLLQFEELGPQAKLAHPTPEHFFPVFFSVGAAMAGDEAREIYRGVQYGSLSMLVFSLESKVGTQVPGSIKKPDTRTLH